MMFWLEAGRWAPRCLSGYSLITSPAYLAPTPLSCPLRRHSSLPCPLHPRLGSSVDYALPGLGHTSQEAEEAALQRESWQRGERWRVRLPALPAIQLPAPVPDAAVLKQACFLKSPSPPFFFFWLSKLQYGFGSSPPTGFV